MSGELPFEMPLAEMRKKIDELKQFGQEKGIDFTDEIARLEERYSRLEEEIYSSISPSENASGPSSARPTSLDLIQLIFTDFIERMEIVSTGTILPLSAAWPNLTVFRSRWSVSAR